jgi:RNA polymerase-interacting CarD/CdnL/TRCF family regulator
MGYPTIRPNPHRYRARADQRRPTVHSCDVIANGGYVSKGTKSHLSPGEREHFVKARQLLSNEIALARDVEPAEANAWIDEQLTRTG